jgi:hypothetical protein
VDIRRSSRSGEHRERQESAHHILPRVDDLLVLGIIAWHERQFGFLLLEVVWTLVSAWGLATRARGAQA